MVPGQGWGLVPQASVSLCLTHFAPFPAGSEMWFPACHALGGAPCLSAYRLSGQSGVALQEGRVWRKCPPQTRCKRALMGMLTRSSPPHPSSGSHAFIATFLLCNWVCPPTLVAAFGLCFCTGVFSCSFLQDLRSQAGMGIVGGLLSRGLQPVPMALSNGWVLAVPSSGTGGVSRRCTRIPSPRSRNVSQASTGVGLFPWSRSGTSSLACCAALGSGVLKKELSSSRRPAGAALEATGASCTREICIGC